MLITLTWLATVSGWARSKCSAICSGELCGGFITFGQCCPCAADHFKHCLKLKGETDPFSNPSFYSSVTHRYVDNLCYMVVSKQCSYIPSILDGTPHLFHNLPWRIWFLYQCDIILLALRSLSLTFQYAWVLFIFIQKERYTSHTFI